MYFFLSDSFLSDSTGTCFFVCVCVLFVCFVFVFVSKSGKVCKYFKSISFQLYLQVFQANTNPNDVVTSLFPAPVYARIVRITCLAKSAVGHNWIMRFEVLGCKM